jgi:hypothetical protein
MPTGMPSVSSPKNANGTNHMPIISPPRRR